ncbi:IQ domain-containing H isoform X1 [Pelobates cultripes]|uniref:IQ domain-containing H isoform X1 n=1 Tax=Pelobates cultripes TaxID=61616 RepID=A0AAD1RMP0_PELCU|nr:IQ domain-containing H isoform X1 [Pelobates cultripes]
MARVSQGTDPVGSLLVQVQNDLEHLRKRLTHTSIKEHGETVDIQSLEKAIQRTELGLKKHTEDYLSYISCNPMTLLHDGSKDKYIPHVIKWSNPVDPTKQTQRARPLNFPDARPHAPGMSIYLSPGQQHKLSLNNRIVYNPESVANRDLLNQSHGISLPLINCKQKTSVPLEKIARGTTVSNLLVLPATHRIDASLPPPPVQDKDMQRGILSLLQRGLIPPSAHLTLVPPPILPRTVPMHSARARRITALKQVTDKDPTKIIEISPKADFDQDYAKSVSLLSYSQLREDGLDTPYPSQHSATGRRTWTSENAVRKDPQSRSSPTSQKCWELTPLMEPTGHSFTIYNGSIDLTAADFLAFHQHFCLYGGSYLTVLQRLQNLLQEYAIPVAVVNGDNLRAILLHQELGMSTSVSQLLSLLENRSSVRKMLSIPGQRYKGKDGRTAAAVSIQAAWRGYRDRKAYLAYSRERWAAGVISIAWMLYVQKSRVRKMLQKSREQQLQNFRTRSKHLASNWNHIRTCRRSIIHIPSLGYTERQRAQTADLHIQQNLQIGRLCDIADPNVNVIYVSPVEIDEETQQYYRRLLGLGAAVISGNSQDACELHGRFTILVPEAIGSFPGHQLCLSTLLKYSPKTLQRIKNLIQGREAYIVGGVMHMDDLEVADLLDVPILGTEPELAHLYRTKSGSKRIFASAGIPTPPGVYDIYNEQQFLDSLGQLIADNLHVTRWLFKVDNEFGGNGTAFCDIAIHLPSYSWALSEQHRYGRDTWKQTWAQEKALRRITQELPEVLQLHTKFVNKRRFPTWWRFLQALISCGGIIEAFPPADSITCLTVDLLIKPDGGTEMVSCGDQIHGLSPLECIGTTVPQCSVPPEILTSICNRVGEACRIRGILGYLSMDLLSFIDLQNLEQQIWATDLDVCYSDQLAMTQLLMYLTSGTLDCTNSRLNVPNHPSKMDHSQRQTQLIATSPISNRVAVLSTRLVHTNLSMVYYNVFFKMCRAHGIGFDVKEKQGTVFLLLENQKRHRLGMLSIAEDLQGALMTFARNLFIIHQEISTPNMQGETNFKKIVQDIEGILGVTEENKLKFDQEGEDNGHLTANP